MGPKEIEARFLEIDKENLIFKLREIGAEDFGEEMLSEIIFYDKNLEWPKLGNEFVKLRKNGKETTLVYKNQKGGETLNSEEVEIKVDDFYKTKYILEKSGLIAFREQEKRRHTFKYKDIIFDIDTWPKIPTYLEIESDSLEKLKEGAKFLDISFEKATFDNPRKVIEEVYNIPIRDLHFFTFSKVE